MEYKKTIWAIISTSFEGIHQYPDAPKEVSFLKHLHRHIFHVKIFIEQFHNDRDVEFIMFKRFIEKIINNKKFPKSASCEMVSDFIYEEIIKKYPKRRIKIEVFEDQENGSQIEYEKN
ncbi:MAG: hypothetical protein ABIF12_03885 [bacterium]